MQTVELTAKSVDEAKQLAATKLGVSADQVQVTVLEETKGLFGKSQVRVRCEAAQAAPAETKTAPETIADVQETFEPKAEEMQAETKRPRRKIGAKAEAAKEASQPAPQPERARTEEPEGDVFASETDAETLSRILHSLIESSGLQVTAKVQEFSGKYVNIQLDGKDAAFLVGKHGEVLNALQYLLNIMSARKITPGVRATLDANDYRRRREEALTKLANRIAEQVLDRGEEAVLDALPAFERRIVHKALSGREGVSTYSEGEEPNRRVVIAPAE